MELKQSGGANLFSSPSKVIIMVNVLVLLGGYGLAFLMATPRLREIEWLAGLPSFDPDNPASGPVVYSGTLHGPADRTTPLGGQAAAYWWAVQEVSDHGVDAQCAGNARTDLTLLTATGLLPIVWMEADPDLVGLVSDDADDDYVLPFSIDVGNNETLTVDPPPPGTCEGDYYAQIVFLPGARVEVVGCAHNGTIVSCDTPIGGVLSAPTLSADRRHRFRSALRPFLIAMGVALVVLIASTFVLFAYTEQLQHHPNRLEEP